MKRLSSGLALLLLGAFYLGWPGYTGYQIHQALEAGDSAALSGKIDIASVKQSLRPAVLATAEQTLKEQLRGTGAGVLGDEVAKRVLPRLVDITLRNLVTPENIIAIYSERGSLHDTIARIASDQLTRYGGITGLGAAGMGRKLEEEEARLASPGNASSVVKTVATVPGVGAIAKPTVRTVGGEATAATAAEPAKPTYGLSNIKHLGPSGLFSMELGVAKDASAKEADVTVEMGFTGTGWKLTGLRPRIQP